MPTPNDESEAASSAEDEKIDGAPSGTEKAPEPDDKGPTLAEVARTAFEESSAREQGKGEKDAENAEGDAQELGKTDEGEEDAEEKEEDSESTDEKEVPPKKEDEDKPPPFDKHPAWVKRTQKFNEAQSKVVELDAKVKELGEPAKNWAYHSGFMKQYGIPQQEVDQMMSFLALARTNPVQAHKIWQQLGEQLSGLDPDVLPKDLAESVKAGDITEDYARRLWKAEATGKAGAVTGRFTAQQMQEREQEARDEAVNSWDQAKRKLDPDFKPKVNGSKDGLWEQVIKGWTFLKVMHQPKTSQDEIRLLETAYTEAKDFVASLRPPIRQGKIIGSKRSSGTSRRGEPTTVDEVVAAAAREHGIDWNGRPKSE